MSALKYVQTPTFYQAGSGSIIGAISITLASFTDIYGNVLTMSDFGGEGYFTCEPDTNNEEAGTFTGVTTNANGTYTLTGVKTALAKSPYTETSALIRQHAGGTKVVITDNVAFWNTFANKNNDETVSGQWTFTNTPIVPGTVSNASTIVKGVAFTSVAPASAGSPTMVETSDPRVPVSYAVDSVGTDSYAITPSPAITAYAAGQSFTFQAGTANTNAATLNVNGLGAKTIKKNTSVDLETGDILANQIITVKYDGTNMQLQSRQNVFEATASEVNIGTQSRTGAELFVNPVYYPAKNLVGALGNSLAKTYFNIQLPFILWTGSTSGAATTDFTNWVRGSSSAFVPPVASSVDFRGTSIEYIVTSNDDATSFFYPGASTALLWSTSNKVVFDCFAKLPTSPTGDIQFGFSENSNDLIVAYNNDGAFGRAVFSLSGTTLYATIAKDGTGVTNTDITSGITVANWNNYRIELDLGSQARFYVNGVLKATLSGANLYTGAKPVNVGFGRSGTALFQATAPNVGVQLI